MYYNCHIHTFLNVDVPDKFLPLSLVRFLASNKWGRFLARILHHINPFTDNDLFDRYARFLTTGGLDSQRSVLAKCAAYYPDGTKFVILPMDMAYMKAGKVPRPYDVQIAELADLASENPAVIPFFHVDPRRPGVFDMFKEAVEKDGFRGLKIYPPLGYFPYDERLYPIYDYCQTNQIPVMSHCSPYNAVHYRGCKLELLKMLLKSKNCLPDLKGKSKKELYSHFSDPRNWSFVLEDFPKLKVCIAHFGSNYYLDKYLDDPGQDDNWFVIIKKMLNDYPNLYTDTSYTLNDPDYFSVLKILLTDKDLNNKILFGSDYYMVQTETQERRFSMDLRAFLGEANFNLIATENPKVFLGE